LSRIDNLGFEEETGFMHVNLTPVLDAYVLAKVKSGRYNNASEVIREALRLMQDQEAQTLAERQGLDEIERGESKDYEGEKGLKQLLREIRAEGVQLLAKEKSRKAKLSKRS
jgi:antitoxin ParD1/3/4